MNRCLLKVSYHRDHGQSSPAWCIDCKASVALSRQGGYYRSIECVGRPQPVNKEECDTIVLAFGLCELIVDILAFDCGERHFRCAEASVVCEQSSWNSTMSRPCPKPDIIGAASELVRGFGRNWGGRGRERVGRGADARVPQSRSGLQQPGS